MHAGSSAFVGEEPVAKSDRAEQRRAVARSVIDRRVGAPEITSTFDHDMLSNYAATRLSASYALPLLIILVAFIASVWLPVKGIAVWTATALMVHGAVAIACHHFLRRGAGTTGLRSWARIFTALEFLTGLIWVALLLAASSVQGDNIEIFQFATMLTVLAIGTMLLSSLPYAALAATAPIALTMVALFAIKQDFLYLALSVLSIGSEIFFLTLSQRLYEATLGSMRLQAEKDQLIAELGTAKAASDESRRRAEEANLAKSRFLASMSHELRTPLNAILGFSEVIKNEVLGPVQNATYREYAGDIHTSGGHLLNLINEILDISRIEAGHYDLTEAPLMLTDVVEDSLHLIRLKIGNKSLKVSSRFEPGLPQLWADERAVRQIALNLLSNAIKFTPSGGEITVQAGWTAGGGQYLSIRDNGPGIPADELPIVLSAFGQGTIAIKSAEQGTGLGLPIVQAMMTMHGGTFELRSELRVGTEAIACFPRSRVLEALPTAGEIPAPRRRRSAG
jgi:two-component system cell cycle sensor histidine kinase PleC